MTVATPIRPGTTVPSRSLARGGLGVVTFAPEGGGVAYVARLHRRALADALGTEPWSVALDPARQEQVSAREALRFGARLLAANGARRVDWLLFNHVGIATAQARLPRAIRSPYAVQLHGVEAYEPLISARHVEALRGAALRLAPSRFTAERGMAAHPDIGPILVCPHGLLPPEPATAGAVDERLLARVGPRSALIVGRMWSSERRKGHDPLLECWPVVRAAVPDAQLIVAGTGDDVARLQRKTAELGITEAVLFCGAISDATRDALLERTAVYAMPSRQEGFGIAYVEAMRAGRPCIGSTDDGATEPIVHGETGFLVEQRDRRALAEALVALLRDDGRRLAMGEAGRRRFESLYTFERYRDRLLALLAETFVPRAAGAPVRWGSTPSGR